MDSPLTDTLRRAREMEVWAPSAEFGMLARDLSSVIDMLEARTDVRQVRNLRRAFNEMLLFMAGAEAMYVAIKRDQILIGLAWAGKFTGLE